MSKTDSKYSVSFHFLLQKDDEKVVYVDSSVVKLLGYKASDFLYEKLRFPELIHKDDQDIAAELFSLRHQLKYKQINVRCRQVNGKIICLHGRYKKITEKSSETLTLLLHLTDARLLAQKTNEKLLSRNFTAMMENSDDYIYFKDRNHVFTGASQTLVELTSPSEHWTDLLGMTDYDVFPEILADAYYRLEKHIFSDNTNVSHELQQTLDNEGSYGWVDNRKYPIKDKTGNVVGLFGIARDISASKLLERALAQTEKRYRTIFNDAPLGIAVIDSLTGSIYEVNPSYEKTVGRSKEELKTINWMKITHPDDIQQDSDNIALMTSGKTNGFKMNKRYIQPDGTIIWINMTVAPMKVENPENPRHLCMIEDITKQKEAENQLKLAETVYKNTDQAIVVTDTDNVTVAVNPAFTKLTGYNEDDVIGKDPMLLQSSRYNPSFYEQLWKNLNSKGRWQGEIWNKKKNGKEFAKWITINSVYDKKGELSQRIALFSDITEKKLADEKVWNQANFDTLTNLPNRNLFGDRLSQEIKAAQRSQNSLALLFMDLDHFKEVNDTLGHEKGDMLLIEAAQRIQKCVRESDTVSRLGGDEFTVILTKLNDAQRVELIAEDILHSLNKPFILGLEKVYVSASIGISLYPDDTDTIGELVKNADQAMYLAKNNGRDQFNYYTQSMQVSAQHRHQLINDMHTALNTGQFQLYYQPIMNLHSREIIIAEAFLRWHHPVHGMICPNDFIPLAEETGIIVEIGDWVFKQVVAQIKHWQINIASDFQVSINSSLMQLRAQEDHEDWLAYIQKHDVSGHNLVIEISENQLTNYTDQIKSQLLNFRANNIQIALDDFGTGYSTITHLSQCDIDFLKIDKTFIHKLSENSEERLLCETIILMAHNFGLRVIAEGIETKEQMLILINAGCDYGQGFLFSEPVPADLFEKLLTRH